jgi:hypothetical protein
LTDDRISWLPPLRVSPEWSQGLYYVVHDALGRLVAQGDKATCDLVAAGRRIFSTQGSLWADDNE